MKPNRNRFKRTSFGLILVWFGYFILKTKNYIVFLNFSNGFGSVFSGLVYFFDSIFQSWCKGSTRRTTTNTLHTRRKSTWWRFQWHGGKLFSDKRWCRTHRWKCIDVINTLAREKHAPTAFWEFNIKIDAKWLKPAPITLEITNKLFCLI